MRPRFSRQANRKAKRKRSRKEACVCVPEGVEIVPARRIGSRGAARVGEHEDGGGEGEAEGRETEDEDERVEPLELVDGDGGVEVVVRGGDSSVRRRRAAAVAEGLRGSHGRRRELQKEKLKLIHTTKTK